MENPTPKFNHNSVYSANGKLKISLFCNEKNLEEIVKVSCSNILLLFPPFHYTKNIN
jgi:hypothetical protein